MRAFLALPAAAVVLLALFAGSVHTQETQLRKPVRRCDGTPDRPARLLTLSTGQTFCLRLPRFLKNPELDFLGSKKFARSYDDTCGLFGIVFSPFVPQGGGPPPHLHYADHEWFLPGTEGDVVRVHAQAANTGPYKAYEAGQVPGFNMPPVSVGGVEVPFGGIGYSPPKTPHTWKAATNLTNFMAIWEFGFSMKTAVNIIEEQTNATVSLQVSGLWGVPTDTTAAMFGGPQFATDARGPLAVPAPTLRDLKRLQSLFDRAEAQQCCKGAC